jgi:hypothetical protein
MLKIAVAYSFAISFYFMMTKTLFEDSVIDILFTGNAQQPSASVGPPSPLNRSHCWLSPPWGTNSTINASKQHVCAELHHIPFRKPQDLIHPYSTAPTLTCPGGTQGDEEGEKGDDDHVTIILLYYAHPKLFREQLHHLGAFPTSLQERLSIIVVDDGSPKGLQAQEYYDHAVKDIRPALSLRSFQIVRVEQNIPWNMPGTQNLGFYLARTSKVLLLDLDAFVPARVVETLFHIPMATFGYSHLAYRFQLGPDIGDGTHPKIMFTTKKAYWFAGGYDEGFVPHYGHTDFAFWYRFALYPRNRIIMSDPRLHLQLRDAKGGKCLMEYRQDDCENAIQNLPNPPKNSDIPINRKILQRRKVSQCWSNHFLKFHWVEDLHMKAAKSATADHQVAAATPLVADTMHSVDNFRVLLGIFSMLDDQEEFARRQLIRDTYLSFYDWKALALNETANGNLICSLQEFRAETKSTECRLVYTFVVGAHARNNTQQPTEVFQDDEMAMNRSSIVSPEDQRQEQDIYHDLTYLDIRENMNSGKSPTWIRYASSLVENGNPLQLDYIVKMDSDTLLLPDKFLEQVESGLKSILQEKTVLVRDSASPSPPPLSSHMIYGGRYQRNAFNIGGCYFLSTLLAKYVADCTNSGRCTKYSQSLMVKYESVKGGDRIEDMEMGLFVKSAQIGGHGVVKRVAVDPPHGIKKVQSWQTQWEFYQYMTTLKHLAANNACPTEGQMLLKMQKFEGHVQDFLKGSPC